MRLISWNIARQDEPWRLLAADDELDVALLQEATAPPDGLDLEVVAGGEWRLAGWKDRQFSAAVVRCSSRVEVTAEPILRPLETAGEDELAVSRPGSLAAARVDGETLSAPIVVVSAYASWERPPSVGGSGWIYADASAHRVISDLSGFIDRQEGHRIIVSGDWNILHGYGEHGSTYWGDRYRTVFDRMEAIGLRFVGPQQPNGQAAATPAAELPAGSLDVPTYRTHRDDPSTGQRQLDFVFASESIADSLTVRALNTEDEWGPSDHCRVLVEITET